MLCAVSDESGVTPAPPSCLSFSLLLQPLSTCLGPLWRVRIPRRFNDTADDDATWHDAQITLLRNVGTAIRAGLQATEQMYKFVCHAGGCSPCQPSLDIRASEANHQFIPAGFSLVSPRLASWPGTPPPSLRPKSWTTTRVCRPATGPSAWPANSPPICEYERSLSQAHLHLALC